MYTTDTLQFRFVCVYNIKLDIRLSFSCASHDHYPSQRVTVYIRKNTYTVLFPFQFRNFVSSYCFGTILKTVFRDEHESVHLALFVFTNVIKTLSFLVATSVLSPQRGIWYKKIPLWYHW